MVPVRLDAVVKVKQREEERKLDAFSKALSVETKAKAVLTAAEVEARRASPAAGTAADFMVDEAARRRALERVNQAKVAVNTATKQVDTSRKAWNEAHCKAEAVGRAADSRRSEVQRELDKKEQRGLDELALLQFARAH